MMIINCVCSFYSSHSNPYPNSQDNVDTNANLSGS